MYMVLLSVGSSSGWIVHCIASELSTTLADDNIDPFLSIHSITCIVFILYQLKTITSELSTTLADDNIDPFLSIHSITCIVFILYQLKTITSELSTSSLDPVFELKV